MSTLKLSEAIRLGAMLKPQGFGTRVSSLRVADTSCALDAAAEALGIFTDQTLERFGIEPPYYAEIQRRYPLIAGVSCPVCHMPTGGHDAEAIWHLNDTHRWTREQIADFVESIEQQHESSAVDQPAVPVTV